MEENSKQFVLVYNSLLLRWDWLETLDLKREKEAGRALVKKGIIPYGIDKYLALFVQLLYQP